jgi:hypothetical protein
MERNTIGEMIPASMPWRYFSFSNDAIRGMKPTR